MADDEATDAGAPAELRETVAIDEVLPGAWWDDAEGEFDVSVVSDGPAEWVETEPVTQVSRELGFGSVYLDIAVYCSDFVEVPLAGEVSSLDGRLEVAAEGRAWRLASDDLGLEPVGVELRGSFDDATFPATGVDPADWTDKVSFVALRYDDAGFAEGSAGWEGQRVDDETAEYRAVYAATFFPAELAPVE